MSKQQKVTLNITDYKRILSLMESNPAKAREEMASMLYKSVAADFYEKNGRVTLGEIAARHERMDARRLPILLEAWDIIRPFYNPDAHKQFRYFRVNVELLGSVLEDSSIRGVRKANEKNPDPQFIDREGNIHRMKYFTNAGADFVSDLLVKHGYRRVDNPVPVICEAQPESDAEHGKITLNAVELAALALVCAEVVPLNGLRSMAKILARSFDGVEFDINSDDLFAGNQSYILYDATDRNAILLKRGEKFYDAFNQQFKEGGAFFNEDKHEIAERVQKAMPTIMEGWKE